MTVRIETVRLSFAGRLVPRSFAEFCDRRAQRLALELAIVGSSEERFTAEVSGQPDLIDAFEMACSLGPLDCLVLDCDRREIRSVSGGKEKR